MRKKKHIVAGICILTILLTKFPVQAQAVTVKINKQSATLFPGKTITLKVVGTSKKVTWSSSNKAVAKVSVSGKVTAVKKGNATIKAEVSGKIYRCKVKVSKQSKKSALKCYKKILDGLYSNVINNSFSYTDGSQYFNNMGYTFRDVNGDGSYELLIGSADQADSMFFKMYSIVSGKPKLIAQTSGWYWYHLCEKHRIKEEVSSLTASYCTLKNGKLKHGKSVERQYFNDEEYPVIKIIYTPFTKYQ